MPGSLLKTGSVYTAYLVRADDTEYAEEVVSVRFKVSGEATGSTTSSTKDEMSSQDANASLTPSTNAAESTGTTQGSSSSATRPALMPPSRAQASLPQVRPAPPWMR